MKCNANKIFEWYVQQVQAFIDSPKVEQFLVGITANEKNRRYAYKKKNFKYFILLDTNMSKEDALKFEEDLFTKFKDNKKYHSDKKKSSYKPSTGGVDHDCYSLYIAAF